MSTGPQPRRFPLRPVALAAVAVAAIVVLVVVLTGDDGPKVEDEIEVGAAPSAVAVGLGGVWVLNNDGGTLVKVDPDSKKIDGRPVQVGEAPQFIALGAGSVWTTAGLGSRVVRVDPRTVRIQKTIVDGLEPTGIAVGEGAVWVADAVGDTVTRIDPRTNRKVGRPIKVGPGPQGVITGGGAVWVANFRGNTVSRIDPGTNRVVETIRVGNGPADLAFGEGGPLGDERLRPHGGEGRPGAEPGGRASGAARRDAGGHRHRRGLGVGGEHRGWDPPAHRPRQACRSTATHWRSATSPSGSRSPTGRSGSRSPKTTSSSA